MAFEEHPRHKGCLMYKGVVVAPNKNAGSVFMLMQAAQTPEVKEQLKRTFDASMKDFNDNWKASGVDFALQNYRVGDDPRWKKD